MILELKDIFSGYVRGVDILKGINLHINEGEIVCLIGPNGCGKSTVLRTICGMLKPSQGKVIFNGKEITGIRPDIILKKGVCHVPQGRSVFPRMTVKENLKMGGYIIKDKKEVVEAIDRVYALFPILEKRKNEKAGYLSGGEQQMLEMGRALMLDPPLMLLDEPSLGLEPRLSDMVFDRVKRLNESGTTIVMVEQNARRGMKAADRGYVLELGQVRLEGPGDELLNNKEVQSLYLGGYLESES